MVFLISGIIALVLGVFILKDWISSKKIEDAYNKSMNVDYDFSNYRKVRDDVGAFFVSIIAILFGIGFIVISFLGFS